METQIRPMSSTELWRVMRAAVHDRKVTLDRTALAALAETDMPVRLRAAIREGDWPVVLIP